MEKPEDHPVVKDPTPYQFINLLSARFMGKDLLPPALKQVWKLDLIMNVEHSCLDVYYDNLDTGDTGTFAMIMQPIHWAMIVAAVESLRLFGAEFRFTFDLQKAQHLMIKVKPEHLVDVEVPKVH